MLERDFTSPAELLCRACVCNSVEEVKAICAKVQAFGDKDEQKKHIDGLAQEIETATAEHAHFTGVLAAQMTAEGSNTGAVVVCRMRVAGAKRKLESLRKNQALILNYPEPAESQDPISAKNLFAFDATYGATALHLAQGAIFSVVWGVLPDHLRAETLRAKDSNQCTPFMSAISQCDSNKVATLLQYDKEWITNPQLGAKILSTACLKGNREVLQQVVNALTVEQLRAIRIAAAKEETSLRLMVQQNNNGLTFKDYYELVLLQQSKFFDAQGNNLLKKACREQDQTTARQICIEYSQRLAKDRSVENAEDIFTNVLPLAASASDPLILKTILETMPESLKQQELAKKDQNGYLPIDHAILAVCQSDDEKSVGKQQGNTKNIRLLLNSVSHTHFETASLIYRNKSPLEFARDNLHDDVYDLLLGRMQTFIPGYRLVSEMNWLKEIMFDYFALYNVVLHPFNFDARAEDFINCLQAIKNGEPFPVVTNNAFVRYQALRTDLATKNVTLFELRDFLTSVRTYYGADYLGAKKLIKKMEDAGLFDWFKEPVPVAKVVLSKR